MNNEPPERRRRRLAARREEARRAGERCEMKFVEWLGRNLGTDFYVTGISAEALRETGDLAARDVGNIDAAVYLRGRQDPVVALEVKSKVPREDSIQYRALSGLAYAQWGISTALVIPAFVPGQLLLLGLWTMDWDQEALREGKMILDDPYRKDPGIFLEWIRLEARSVHKR